MINIDVSVQNLREGSHKEFQMSDLSKCKMAVPELTVITLLAISGCHASKIITFRTITSGTSWLSREISPSST